MRTLNVRWAIGIVVVSLAIGGVVHAVHGLQVRNHSIALRREAERAKEQGRSGDAIRLLQRYVRLARDDSEALAELGLLQADAGLFDQAFLTLEGALRRNANKIDVRRKLVEVAIRLDRAADARTHLEEHLLPRSPDDADLLNLLGQCQESLGEHDAAVATFRRAVENNPAHLEAYSRLADVLDRHLDRGDEADKTLNAMVQSNPANARAYVIRATYRRTHAHIDGALADVKAALAIAPDDADVLAVAADCAQAAGNNADASSYARRGIELRPNFAQFYRVLAAVELSENGRQRAIETLRQGLAASPNHVDLLWNLSNLLIEDGKLDEAQQVAAQLKQTDFTADVEEYLQARILYSQRKWFQAASRFQKARPSLNDWPELAKQTDLWIGHCYEQLERPDQQLRAYRQAINTDPLWIPARMGAARALLALGNVDESIAEYQQIARMPNAPVESLIEMARLMILVNFSREQKDRNWGPVLALLERPQVASVPYAAVLRAEVLTAQSRLDDAQRLLDETLAANKTEISLWSAAIEFAQRLRNWDKAKSLIDQARQATGDSPALRLAQARFAARSMPREKAVSALSQLAQPGGEFSEDEQLDTWRGLAMVCLALGDTGEAIRLCEAVAAKRPQDLHVRLLLFDLAFRDRRDDDMQRILSEVESITGKGALWRYGEAARLSILAQAGQPELYDRALEQLREARLARSSWYRLPLLAAQINELQRDEDSAIENYLAAVDLGERNANLISRVVRLLYKHQRFAQADQVIRRLQAQQQEPFTSDLVRLAANVSMRLEDYGRAIDLARQAAGSSQNYEDHVWYAQVLAVAGQHKEAEASFRRAVALKPEAVEPHIGLIRFLSQSRQAEEAEAALDDAQKNFTGDDALIKTAQCFEAAGRIAEAQKQYAAASQQRPKDLNVARQAAEFFLQHGKTRQAENELRKLVAIDDPAEQTLVRWGRRNLALALASQKSPEHIKESLALVELNLKEDKASQPDLRAKAVVLSADGTAEARIAAIALLEPLVAKSGSAAPRDQFLLARLYLANADWPKASKQMRSILASNAADARYIAAYVDALLTRNELNEADLWIKELERHDPGGLASTQLRLRALALGGQIDQAVNLATQYVDQNTRQIPQPHRRLEAVTLYLDQLAAQFKLQDRPDDAARLLRETETLLRHYASSDNKSTLVLAAYLARQNRTEEALELAEPALASAAPEEIAGAVSTILARSAHDASRRLDRLERMLAAAIKQYPKSIPLKTVAAELAGWKRQYKKAVAYYREVLALDGRNLVAMNNLALLLALEENQGDEALRLINQALEIREDEPAFLDSRATIFLALGKPQDALVDLEKSLAAAPAAQTLFHQALAHRQLGQRESARAAYDKAIKLGLDPQTLHPLEKPLLAQLQADLK